MKPLNKQAYAIFSKIMALLGGKAHIVIDNSQGTYYMPLVVERLGKTSGKFKGELFSFAHYFTQDGDYMRDPDVVFLVAGDMAFPISFRQDSLGFDAEYADLESGAVQVKQQADLASFCNQWMKNIAEQQGL